MVDLTPQPGSAISRAPQPGVSPQEVAQPYAELANALNKSGEALTDTAVEQAGQEGYSAVSRDAQGNLQIQKMPLLGAASIAYSRAVKFGAIAEGEADARAQDIALREQFRDDPQGYLAAARAYKDKTVQQYTAAGGADLGITLGRLIDTTTVQTFRGLQSEHERLTLARADKSIQAQIQATADDMINFARSGGDPNSPEAAQMRDKLKTLTMERVNNPRLAYPIEQAHADADALNDQIGAARFLHTIDTAMTDPNGGVKKAMALIDQMNADSSLTPQQKDLYRKQGVQAINQNIADQNRRDYINTKLQKQKDETFEQSVITDSASPNPKITETDIKNDPNASAESKMRMIAWQERQNKPDPLAKVSQQTSMDLFRRMNLPDGDPDRINDLSAIRQAYINGGLNRTDEDWLEKRFTEARNPEGQRLDAIRQQFSKAVTPLIDKSNPLLGKVDESGKLQSYQFERMVDAKVSEYRKEGKNPFDLFDPSKPDYLGKPEAIAPFKVPLSQSIQHAVENLTGAPPPGAASIRTNNPGAQWPNGLAERFGSTGFQQLPDGNKIAQFPTPVHGAAANMALLDRSYVGLTIGQAQTKWSGGHRAGLPGFDNNKVITKEMTNDPNFMIPFMKATANAEAPRGANALSDSQWRQAFDMFKQGGATGIEPPQRQAGEGIPEYLARIGRKPPVP